MRHNRIWATQADVTALAKAEDIFQGLSDAGIFDPKETEIIEAHFDRAKKIIAENLPKPRAKKVKG